ncbi:PHD-finger family protein [Brugia malayi]|uniref:Bm3641, isoform a; Bm3641, isoform g n=4 Tax=Brugia malayi TaxID=6279 RepID=A0A4E9FB58_BRUMA|nr:PHD-finger family protein [Brugia malayi]VIO94057.1 PHD-finger family protein [Brugia malayi]
MPRGRPRGRGRSSAGKTVAKSSPSCYGRNRGRAKLTGISMKSKSTKTSKSRENRQAWDESDEEYDRPDYYTDSSDGFDSDTSTAQRNSAAMDFEDEAEDEEIEETSSVASRVPTPGASLYETDESVECPWLEIPAEQLPILKLPKGSKDLLIDEKYLFDALEVYETCRWYYQAIRLSPFLFEDFCAALSTEGQTNLLAEIHIALLKLSLKDDDDEQIILSVQDTNNSFNIMLQLLEPMTYAEVLRQYLESDPQRFPAEVLEAASGNYPFVGVKQRLTVLSWLCDRFFQTNEYRNIVRNEGKLTVDEHCRECGKPGDVLLCDGCEACYHLSCTNLADVPDGKWLCQVCELHKVRGVTDCQVPGYRSPRMPMRFKPLGRDRHGRLYWFMVRRIFVQNDIDGSVHYYSTLPQLYFLLNMLSVNEYEKHLAAVFMDLLPLIEEHMRMTLQLTGDYGRSARARNKTDLYLHADNVVRMGDILAKPLFSQLRESDDERIVVAIGYTKHVEVSKYLLLCKVEELLGFTGNCLKDTFWTAGMQTHEVITKKEVIETSFHTALVNGDIDEVPSVELGFRLGEGDTLSRYVNQYSMNEYAKNPIQRAKERDKKKYMSGRFSLMDEGEFEWTVAKGRTLTGKPIQIGKIIQNSMESFAQKIPSVLMHRLWKRDGLDYFKKGLSAPPTVELLKDLLLRFECAIRRPVLHNVWWSTLGHTRLIRITVEDRERRQRYETKKKKQERELWAAEPDDDEVIWVKHHKVGSILKRTLWRQNDEGYRVNGRGTLGGWLWKSNTFHRTFIPRAEKPNIGKILEPTSLANRKAIHLEKIVKCLNEWRIAELEGEERKWQKELLKKCYSPTCRMGIMPLPITSENDSVQGCYSLTCRQAVSQSMGRTTSSVVHARPPSSSPSKSHQENGKDVKTLEMNKPFPLPLPFDYRVRRTGEQSLLILPQKALKRLARQGGINLNYFAPGFHRLAKSNNQVWNYPCQRPLFDNCWRYLVLRAQSYHSIALHLRVLYACIRWADMHREPDEDFRVTVHLADHDEVRTVIGHKEYPPDGMYEQYKLSVELIPLDDNVELDDANEGLGSAAYHPSKSLEKTLRKRKATRGRSENGALRKDHVKVVERWIDGIELKPWEIANYWKNIENRARRGLNAPSVITVGNRIPAPVIKHYESQTVHSNRISGERRRPQPKRMPDYDYDIKDDEDEDDDDEYIDVETLPSIVEKSNSSLEPRPKVSRLSEQRSERHLAGSPYKAQWQNPNILRQYEQVARRPGELLGGGKYTMFQKPDGTFCRVMVYQNHPTQSTRTASAPGSVRTPPMIASQPRTGTYQRESVRIPVTRRVVSVPGSSHGSPVAPVGKRLLLIRRSDGTTQYLRPVTTGTGTPGAYRTVRTTQAGGATINDVRGSATNSPFVRPLGTTRTVFTGNQSVGRVLRLPARTVSVVNQPSSTENQASSTVRIGRMQPKRRVDGDEMLNDHSTDPSTAQVDEEYRLLTEKGLRSSGKPLGTAPVSGSTRPAVTVQPRQGLTAVVHSALDQQTSSGHIFGDHDPMVGSGSSAIGGDRYANMVRTETRTAGVTVRAHHGAEVVRVGLHGRGVSSLYGKTQNELTDMTSSVGHSYASCRTHIKYIGTIDIRSNLYIRPFEQVDQRVIKEVLDNLITEVCIMDAENGWHRRHIQRIFEKRQEERKRREMQQRALKIERLSARQLEAELGERIEWFKREVNKRRLKLEERAETEAGMIAPWRRPRSRPEKRARELFPDSSAQLQAIAGMPVEPSTISLGGIIHSDETASNKVDEQSTIQLPSENSNVQCAKTTGLIPDLSIQQQSGELSVKDQPLMDSGQQVEDTSQQRRSERSKKKKSWDESFIKIESLSTSQIPDSSETKTNGKTRKEQLRMTRGTTPSTSSRPGTACSESIPDIDTTKRHCKCNQPYDPKKFYVGCDLCYQWFHGKCVGISERKSKKMTSWLCADCAKEQKSSEKELYCVCQTPYDDSQFYVGCDGCEGWFHPRCVDITQEDAEKAAEYLCPQCTQNKQANESSTSSSPPILLDRPDFDLLWHAFDSLKSHRTSWPFRQAVDQKNHPDYYSIIKKPMDLSIVQRKLEHYEYHSLKEFTTDIAQIFENARIFNSKDSAIYQCADILEKQFRERIVKVKSAIETRASGKKGEKTAKKTKK